MSLILLVARTLRKGRFASAQNHGQSSINDPANLIGKFFVNKSRNTEKSAAPIKLEILLALDERSTKDLRLLDLLVSPVDTSNDTCCSRAKRDGQAGKILCSSLKLIFLFVNLAHFLMHFFSLCC